MRVFDAPLKNEIASNGIVSFELAKDLETSIAILKSWDDKALLYAGLSLGFDYLFMFSYTYLLILLLKKLSIRTGNKIVKLLGTVLVVLMIVAGFSDAIENYAMIKLYLGNLEPKYSLIAYYFAMVKFTIIAISIVFLLFIGVWNIGKRDKTSQKYY